MTELESKIRDLRMLERALLDKMDQGELAERFGLGARQLASKGCLRALRIIMDKFRIEGRQTVKAQRQNAEYLRPYLRQYEKDLLAAQDKEPAQETLDEVLETPSGKITVEIDLGNKQAVRGLIQFLQAL